MSELRPIVGVLMIKHARITSWKQWHFVFICIVNLPYLYPRRHGITFFFFSSYVSGQPRTLQDLCRVKIRHCIGLQSLKFLDELPIAKVMKDYLKHKFDNVWPQPPQPRGVRLWTLSVLIKTMQSRRGGALYIPQHLYCPRTTESVHSVLWFSAVTFFIYMNLFWGGAETAEIRLISVPGLFQLMDEITQQFIKHSNSLIMMQMIVASRCFC